MFKMRTNILLTFILQLLLSLVGHASPVPASDELPVIIARDASPSALPGTSPAPPSLSKRGLYEAFFMVDCYHPQYLYGLSGVSYYPSYSNLVFSSQTTIWLSLNGLTIWEQRTISVSFPTLGYSWRNWGLYDYKVWAKWAGYGAHQYADFDCYCGKEIVIYRSVYRGLVRRVLGIHRRR